MADTFSTSVLGLQIMLANTGKVVKNKEFSLIDRLGWDQVVGEVKATPSL